MSKNSIEKRLEGNPFASSYADKVFIDQMRTAAANGVGYGFMQQVTEWEWQDTNDHSWGPEYFGEEIKRLTVEANTLKGLLFEALGMNYLGQPMPQEMVDQINSYKDTNDSGPTPIKDATVCDSCSEPTAIDLDGIRHCLTCGASVNSSPTG